ncbi:Ig domain containing protein [Alcaligenes phage vB_Af_QDWS595]|uniref:Capsid decorating protein n=1 Tax=Alcaligenes phage vB_Af_QDWS595 TaxID=2877946 RepID=A0AAE9C0J3_9CAUD|nr:Ig domain containing protein [Alcaligenes phage vB_Af_QDWS595]UCR75541.1 capsid decorating protein [Alcaligenes phage vB_Af_QDWS595]
MPIIKASYDPTTRTVAVQETGQATPSGYKDIGTFHHPDENYPDSYVIFHGVRDLLYLTKTDGTAGFFPDNITDMQSIIIDSKLPPVIPLTGIVLKKPDSPIEVELTHQLVIEYVPGTATDKSTVYTSDNEEVATVSQTGLVTGVAAGTAKITAKSGKFTSETEVTVE